MVLVIPHSRTIPHPPSITKYEEAQVRSDFDSLVVQPLQRLPWLTKLQLEEASQMVWQGTSEATFLTAFSSLRRKAVHCTWWQELLKPHFPLLLVWLGGKAPGKELFPPGPNHLPIHCGLLGPEHIPLSSHKTKFNCSYLDIVLVRSSSSTSS